MQFSQEKSNFKHKFVQIFFFTYLRDRYGAEHSG